MKKKSNLLLLGALALALTLALTGCPDLTGGEDTVEGVIDVTFSSLTTDGSATATTTTLTLTFSQAITGLAANDITLSGVSGAAAGTLTNTSGGTYTLGISGFTAGGTLSVAVTKDNYSITGSPKQVTVYYYSNPNDPGDDPNDPGDDPSDPGEEEPVQSATPMAATTTVAKTFPSKHPTGTISGSRA